MTDYTDPTSPASGPARPPFAPPVYPAPVYVAPVTVTTRARVPHLLHAILTLFSFGAWAPVWILHTIFHTRTVTTTSGPSAPRAPRAPREHKPWTRERVIRTAVPAAILFVLILIIVAI
jgi:hypothetical protein